MKNLFRYFFMLILIGKFFTICTTAEAVTSKIKISEGIYVKEYWHNPIIAWESGNFDFWLEVENVTNENLEYAQLCVAVHNIGGNATLQDLICIDDLKLNAYSKRVVGAGRTYSLNVGPGTYQLIAKVKFGIYWYHISPKTSSQSNFVQFEVSEKPPVSYSWYEGSWGSCDNTCGYGSKYRTVKCKSSDGNYVSDSYCSGSKPSTQTNCYDTSGCRYEWHYGNWGQCSNNCGQGSQTRSATCKDQNGNVAQDYKCSGTPITTQNCTSDTGCIYNWSYGSWGQCSTTCGEGTQTRTATCKDQNGNLAQDYKCGTAVKSQTCTSDTGCKYNWVYGSWGQCSTTCGEGTQTRTATCKDQNGNLVQNNRCTLTPETSQICTSETGCNYQWNYGSWGECNNSCGVGIKTRTAQCKNQLGDIVKNEKCNGTPEISLQCEQYTYQWQESMWGLCNADCNSSGQKMRDVYCKRCDETKSNDINCTQSKPTTLQTCYNDCKIPLVLVNSHTNGQEVYEALITISGTASDSDGTIQKVQIKLNDGQWQDGIGTEKWSKQFELKKGNNLISLRSQDNDNQWSEEIAISIFFKLTEEPLIDVSNIQNVSANSGEIEIIVNNSGSGNLVWNASIDKAYRSWLNIKNGAFGSDGDSIIVSYHSNTGEQRTGRVVVIDDKAQNSPQYVDIIQDKSYALSDYNVWLVPKESSVAKNSNFQVEVHTSTLNQKLGSYQFVITFDTDMIDIDTTNVDKGVGSGKDGFFDVINDQEPGKLIINGFDMNGKDPGEDLHLLQLYFKTFSTIGSTNIELAVPTLTNELAETIGTLKGKGTTIQIIDFIIGDVNGNSDVTIADALLVARYSANLVVNSFIEVAADVNTDGKINIADALLIARKAAGLESYRKRYSKNSNNIVYLKLQPDMIEVEENNTFVVDINISTSDRKIGSYQFELTFDTTLLEVDTTMGDNGVEVGDNGFLSVVNTDNLKGTVIINGFNTYGIGPGDSLNIVKTNFRALKQTSESPTKININVKALTDEVALDIDNIDVTGSAINIITKSKPTQESSGGNGGDSGSGCFMSTILF